MKCSVKTFGITRDIAGAKEVVVELPEGSTVADFKNELFSRFPRLSTLTSLFIAVNQSYAEDGQVLNEEDEIALIPPVAGG
ncbi:MAG: MoaD/ThiS family protein [Cyclobacteriaceae bacterium]|nr:MoaD/ThiS family protein [Cyclobacteriaceae bacterium]UYN88528.1 MAG: MoaD/ThiS family protein [Cyclobacteriaceae bacterium]